MAKLINLTTPEFGVSNGMELSFRAPCDCSNVTGVSLDGVTYNLVDASGVSLEGCSTYFKKDAILTVIINTTDGTATLLNPLVNNYTKTLGTASDTPNSNGTTVWSRVKYLTTALGGKASATHTHTTSDITDFSHNHDERYYTETEVDSKLNDKANTGHQHSKSDITDFPTKLSDFRNDVGYLAYEEDPTVPDWAKAPNKPTYTAEEVGASPTSHKHSNLSGYVASYTNIEDNKAAGVGFSSSCVGFLRFRKNSADDWRIVPIWIDKNSDQCTSGRDSDGNYALWRKDYPNALFFCTSTGSQLNIYDAQIVTLSFF